VPQGFGRSDRSILFATASTRGAGLMSISVALAETLVVTSLRAEITGVTKQ